MRHQSGHTTKVYCCVSFFLPERSIAAGQARYLPSPPTPTKCTILFHSPKKMTPNMHPPLPLYCCIDIGHRYTEYFCVGTVSCVADVRRSKNILGMHILYMFSEDDGDLTAKLPAARRHWASVDARRASEQRQLLVWRWETGGRSERSHEGSLRPAGLEREIFEIASRSRWRISPAVPRGAQEASIRQYRPVGCGARSSGSGGVGSELHFCGV